jgi:hypothetical protein
VNSRQAEQPQSTEPPPSKRDDGNDDRLDGRFRVEDADKLLQFEGGLSWTEPDDSINTPLPKPMPCAGHPSQNQCSSRADYTEDELPVLASDLWPVGVTPVVYLCEDCLGEFATRDAVQFHCRSGLCPHD